VVEKIQPEETLIGLQSIMKTSEYILDNYHRHKFVEMMSLLHEIQNSAIISMESIDIESMMESVEYKEAEKQFSVILRDCLNGYDIINDSMSEYSSSSDIENTVVFDDTNNDPTDLVSLFDSALNDTIVPKGLEDDMELYKDILRVVEEQTNNGDFLKILNDINPVIRKENLKQIKSIVENDESTTSPIFKLLRSQAPIEVKKEIWKRMNAHNPEHDHKMPAWLDCVLQYPYGKLASNIMEATKASNLPKFFASVDDTLDKVVFGHKEAKHQIKTYLAQRRTNPNSFGKVLGLQGPMGNGKTTLIEKGLSKVLGLPFYPIPLGGSNDSSILKGFGYTYEGSRCGKIIDAITKMGCENGIIYFDELDKISKTRQGYEVENLLIHLVDPSQNKHFQDNYLGVDVDLSKITFVFSYNDPSQINPILLDRITQVETTGFTTTDKVKIAEDYLIPDICKELNLDSTSFNITTECIRHLIDAFTFEGGVRGIRKVLSEILGQINLETLCSVKRRKTSKTNSCRVITEENLSTYLIDKLPYVAETIHNKPEVGKINGLYATTGGVGGVLPIEVKFVPADSTLNLSITGNLGKVMTESTKVAKTLVWGKIKESTRQMYLKKWSTHKEGLHIHCPDAAVQKEGPSAGTALSVILYSLFENKPIPNKIGITGEINLFGDVLRIGGLRDKLYGAKRAGCRICLFPIGNLQDYELILRKYPDLIEKGKFEAKPVANFDQVLGEVFGKSNLKKRKRLTM